MKLLWMLAAIMCCILRCEAQHLLTPFEKSGGKRSATYQECMSFYKTIEENTNKITIEERGYRDINTPLSIVVYPGVGPINHATEEQIQEYRKQEFHKLKPDRLTILINNGIHPGEPDGIDASMMLMRDIAEGRLRVPDKLQLVVIPIYNFGGALNRNNTTRVNQAGPESYGFRGNGQNLDLNRDFIKRDAGETKAFNEVFNGFDPDIFIDTHVSDGADYQHVMTLLSTQYDKLGGTLGAYFRRRLDPMLYKRMDVAGWPMVPYVNAEESPEKGWTAFYDPPRFSSGYAALYNCIAWVPETHMLKPFDQRVKATYTLLKQMILLAGEEHDTIISLRRADREAVQKQKVFPLAWKDSAATMWLFKGYKAATEQSGVTGLPRLYYDHKQPFNKAVPIRDYYAPVHSVLAPKAYMIPAGWMSTIVRRMLPAHFGINFLECDSIMDVVAYTIDSFKTSPAPYEGHYKHSAIHATPKRTKVLLQAGDCIVNVSGPARRFLIEALEPEGEDSYFAWGFFDAILQRKEGYADYRWEDVAARELKEHPEIKAALEAKKAAEPVFAKDAAAQLLFVYQHSRWYEPEHMRYPVYRIE